MAPISEKRSPPPHIKENAKENAASKQLTKKSLEILDFHESWLRDIEVYKNQVRLQQMLATHNHVHTTEGCPTESAQNSTGKRRIQQRNLSSSLESKSENGTEFEGSNFKRPREETSRTHYVKTHSSSNTKRNNPINAASFVQNQQNVQETGTAKIIVNSFHASSLLSQRNGGDLSARILAAGSSQSTALSVRLPHKQPKTATTNNNTTAIVKQEEEESNQVVSNTVDTARSKEEPYVVPPGPYGDTCQPPTVDNEDKDSVDFVGDIDDLNAYEDSEDDADEYVGYPFVLDSDHHIKCMSEAVTVSYSTPQSILTPSLFPQVPPYLTFSSHEEKGPNVPAALHKILKWKLSPVMPRIVRRVIFNSGFRLIKKTTDWMAVWEKHMRSPGFKTIRSHQKFNHLPGSFRIGRKDSMWKNIRNYMSKHGKREFGFMQKTYILPEEINELRKVWPRSASKARKWIVKPPASARGAGISVVNKWTQIPKDKSLIVQKYIEKPLLINENKFDLRLYVLVTSVNPLRIFMYKNGLARFASVKYSAEQTSLNDRCMHLTNYSINKFSENYAKNEDINACQGHKWTLQSLWTYLEKRGVDTKRLWATLRNLVIKSIISGEGGLNRMYRQHVNNRYNCYELFGFDVLLDENLVPWLLEINISPSLHSELPLDLHVKGPLIQGVLNTALYQVPPKLTMRQQAEILRELNLPGPLCYDRQLFTPILSSDEIKKHNFYTSRLIEFREEYMETILDALTPDDVRCLLIAEDELARSHPLERIFPNADTYKFLQFLENPRYYNRLLDAWENKYSGSRKDGRDLLCQLCREGHHLKVPPAALLEEPKIELTDIDLMYLKPDEIVKLREPKDSLNDKINDDVAPKDEVTKIIETAQNVLGPQTCTLEAADNFVPCSPRPIAVESPAHR